MESTPASQTPDDRASEPTALSQIDPMYTSRNSGAAEAITKDELPPVQLPKAQMHATGSVTDMSAAWSAKVVAAASDQVRAAAII